MKNEWSQSKPVISIRATLELFSSISSNEEDKHTLEVGLKELREFAREYDQLLQANKLLRKECGISAAKLRDLGEQLINLGKTI